MGPNHFSLTYLGLKSGNPIGPLNEQSRFFDRGPPGRPNRGPCDRLMLAIENPEHPHDRAISRPKQDRQKLPCRSPSVDTLLPWPRHMQFFSGPKHETFYASKYVGQGNIRQKKEERSFKMNLSIVLYINKIQMVSICRSNHSRNIKSHIYARGKKIFKCVVIEIVNT